MPQGSQCLGKALWVAQTVEGALGRHVWGGVLTILSQCDQGIGPSEEWTHPGAAVCRASGVGPGCGVWVCAAPPGQRGCREAFVLVGWQAPLALFKGLWGYLGHDPRVIGAQGSVHRPAAGLAQVRQALRPWRSRGLTSRHWG